MRKNAIAVTIFIFFITIVFCCPSAVWAGSSPNKKKPGNFQLHSPIRLTMTSEGNLLASDYQSGMVVTIDHNSLKATHCFPVEGRPLGVAYAKGHIYVGNVSKKCVEVYNRGGKKMFNLGSPTEVIKHPTDIAVDERSNYLFVVDGVEKSVKMFHLIRGQYIRTIPTSNPNNTILANPTGIAVDPASKEVFVSDYGDDNQYIQPRIQILDYNGNLVDTISGKQGMFGTRFSRPQGLAVDESGHVFMVDCYSSEILVFDRFNGDLLKTLGGYGTEPGQLRLPLDIVINSTSKDIYVTNNRSATIEIFLKGGQL